MWFYFWTFLVTLYGVVLQQVSLPRLIEPYRAPIQRRWKQARQFIQRIVKWLQTLLKGG